MSRIGDATFKSSQVIDSLIFSEGCNIDLSKAVIGLNKVKKLYQRSFDSGTFRIKEPGHYILSENVQFNPIASKEKDRSDKPLVGWFAAISIECENVILDLGGFSLSAHPNFVSNHHIKVYANIELSNAPFPGAPFPLNTVAFIGDTVYKRGTNVIIRNGVVGLSSHHGIHGNGNDCIFIEDLMVTNFEVTGITLNSLSNSEIKNITIVGSSHTIKNRSRPAQLQTILNNLKEYQKKPNPDSKLKGYIDSMESILAKELATRTQAQITAPDGNTYGLAISPSPAAGGPRFDNEACTNVPDFGYTKLPSNILIENVTINNIVGQPNQQVCCAGNIIAGNYQTVFDTPILQQLVSNHAGAFGCLLWDDFYPAGSFVPNDVVKSQTLLLRLRRQELEIASSVAYFVPVGFEENMLDTANPVEGTFLSHVQPAFDFDIAHVNKGVFGMKIGCGNDITIKNCKISKVYNVAPLSKTLSDIPGGDNYTAYQVGLDKRYKGNDAFGISLENCQHCKLTNNSVTDIKSDNGHATGIQLFGESKDNQLDGNKAQKIVTIYDGSAQPNPTSVCCGFYFLNSDNNRAENEMATNVSCPRNAFGAKLENSSGNHLEDFTVSDITCNATTNLGNVAKTVCGFDSEDNRRNMFKKCVSFSNIIEGEGSEVSKTISTCTGMRIKDTYSSLLDSEICCNDGGAGNCHGLLLTGSSKCYIKDNVISGNHASNSVGDGYGITDISSDSTFVNNTVTNNETLDSNIT